jgi:hypothetical protein
VPPVFHPTAQRAFMSFSSQDISFKDFPAATTGEDSK